LTFFRIRITELLPEDADYIPVLDAAKGDEIILF